MKGFFPPAIDKASQFQQLLDKTKTPLTKLENCLAWYNVAIFCIETEREHEWFNMKYGDALKYIDNAITSDFFLGHLLKSFVCMKMLVRLNWIVNPDQQALKNKIDDAACPAILLSLQIFMQMIASKELNMTPYEKILKGFVLFDKDIEFMSETFLYQLKNALSNYEEYGLRTHSVSRNEIEKIKSEACNLVNDNKVNQTFSSLRLSRTEEDN